MVDKLGFDGIDNVMYNEAINEDVYMGRCDLRRPPCGVAARFSVETNAAFLMEKYGLPFGFHALNVYDAPLYARLVEESFKGKDILQNAGK